MAKFLNTSGVNFYLEELIKNTNSYLFLITPYLQFSERIKEHLHNLNLLKKDIRIVYKTSELHPDQNKWLSSQLGIRTSICANLHAKCYLNENECIITSMNLYEFSQQNNNEMGIYITKKDDAELYNDVSNEVQRLLKISEEVRVTIEKVKDIKQKIHFGYCISTGIEISFNPDIPFCKDAFRKWSKNDNEFQNYCNYSGEPTNEVTFLKPISRKNWNKAKNLI